MIIFTALLSTWLAVGTEADFIATDPPCDTTGDYGCKIVSRRTLPGPDFRELAFIEDGSMLSVKVRGVDQVHCNDTRCTATAEWHDADYGYVGADYAEMGLEKGRFPRYCWEEQRAFVCADRRGPIAKAGTVRWIAGTPTNSVVGGTLAACKYGRCPLGKWVEMQGSPSEVVVATTGYSVIVAAHRDGEWHSYTIDDLGDDGARWRVTDVSVAPDGKTMVVRVHGKGAMDRDAALLLRGNEQLLVIERLAVAEPHAPGTWTRPVSVEPDGTVVFGPASAGVAPFRLRGRYAWHELEGALASADKLRERMLAGTREREEAERRAESTAHCIPGVPCEQVKLGGGSQRPIEGFLEFLAEPLVDRLSRD